MSIVRSSAAEYLTFVAATGKGGVEAVYADENIWLTQKMMGVLYDVETHTVNYHLKKVFSDSELEENSVIRNFRITAADGKNYNTKHSTRRSPIFTPRPLITTGPLKPPNDSLQQSRISCIGPFTARRLPNY
jgi:hypothetical protein